MSGLRNHGNTTIRRLALMLIISGLLFAIDSILNLSVVYKFWPILVASAGIGLIGIFFERRAGSDPYLSSGGYLICFSILALYCNFTSWRFMAEFWPVLIGLLGVVFVIASFFQQRKTEVLLVGLLILSLSVCFSLVIAFGIQLWWSILILGGLSILISSMANERQVNPIH